MKVRYVTALLGCFLFGLLVESRVLAHCPTCFGCETCFCPVCLDDDSKCTGCCYLCVDALCLADPLLCSGCCSCTACQCLDDDSLCLPWVEVCCDCACEPACEEVEDEEACSSDKDVLCPNCVGVLGECAEYPTSVYTNAIIYDCSGGCPGDCDVVQPRPVCFRVYRCATYIYYRYAECRPPIPSGPIDCYGTQIPWGCTRCQQGGLWVEVHKDSSRCQ